MKFSEIQNAEVLIRKKLKILLNSKNQYYNKNLRDGANYELEYLLEDYHTLKTKEEAQIHMIEKILLELPDEENLLFTSGVSIKTVFGFIA